MNIDAGEETGSEEEEDDGQYGVWEENWPMLEVFLRLTTQWRVGMGGITGLDYGAIDVLFRLYDVALTRENFETLQAMELAALHVFSEKAEKQRAEAKGVGAK